MSEDSKPVFPRSSELSEEEKKRLFGRTRENLENEERAFFSSKTAKICPVCGRENRMEARFCRNCQHNFEPPDQGDQIIPVYGPPPMEMDDDPLKASEMFLPEVYGPPPMRLDDKPDDEIHTTVYGPPPMMLEEEERNFKFPNIDSSPAKGDDYFPPMPVYGPPPMRITDTGSKNKTVWIVGGIILLVLLFLGAVIAGILFFVLRS